MELLTYQDCKAKRINLRMSLLELARAAGVAFDTLREFEEGNPGTRMATIRKLEAAFQKLESEKTNQA